MIPRTLVKGTLLSVKGLTYGTAEERTTQILRRGLHEEDWRAFCNYSITSQYPRARQSPLQPPPLTVC